MLALEQERLPGPEAMGAQRFFFLWETLFTDPDTGDLFSTICLWISVLVKPSCEEKACFFFFFFQVSEPLVSKESLQISDLLGVLTYKQSQELCSWLIETEKWLALRQLKGPAWRVMVATGCVTVIASESYTWFSAFHSGGTGVGVLYPFVAQRLMFSGVTSSQTAPPLFKSFVNVRSVMMKQILFAFLSFFFLYLNTMDR